jgi:uncharacterized damage-inducible protein DinB
MSINTPLLMELQHEMKSSRKMLERVPFEQGAWKPHEKSSSLLALAAHVARVPSWVERAITMDEFDMGIPGAFPKVEPPKDMNELLGIFDKHAATAIALLEGASDETLMKPWTFRNGEKVFFTMPKAAVIRNMAFNHHYHHRGQLSVYLRLLNVPVPGMYGPSADEQRM